MKKLLLSMLLVFSLLIIAKSQTLNQQWYLETAAGGIVNSSQVNSALAYNPVTNKLYVGERGGEIYIINPDDYSSGALNSTAYDVSTKKLARPTTGVNAMTETNRFYKVKVTTKGVIYSIAMQTNGLIYIYKWLSESDSSPKKFAIQDPTIYSRVGDSFAVYEDDKGDADATNDEVYLYTAGANTGTTGTTMGQFLYVMKDDAKTDATSVGPIFFKTIDMSAAKYNSTILDIAKGSISPESANVVWVKSFQVGVNHKRLVLDFTNGNVSSFKNYGGTGSDPNSNTTFGAVLNERGSGILLAGSGSAAAYGLKFTLLSFPTAFGVEPATMTKVTEATLPKGAYTASTGYGDFAIRKNLSGTTTAIYFLVSKNGLASYQPSAPLPVSLTSFNAAVKSGQSTLTWQTASENNAKGFEILSSTDGKTFAKAGYVDSKAINGTATTANSYAFVDKNAKIGYNYYKLKQLDLDCKEELFDKVVSTNLTFDDTGFSAYPNPVKSTIIVNAGILDYKGVKYELFDAVGKKVLSEHATGVSQQLALHHLSSSIYYLKISKDSIHQKTIKIIKQ